MFEVFGGRELLFVVILKWCVSREKEKGEGRRRREKGEGRRRREKGEGEGRREKGEEGSGQGLQKH